MVDEAELMKMEKDVLKRIGRKNEGKKFFRKILGERRKKVRAWMKANPKVVERVRAAHPITSSKREWKLKDGRLVSEEEAGL